MAGPLAGIPWLLAGIGSIAGSFLGHMSRDTLKKLVIIAKVVAALVVFIAAIFTTLTALVNGIAAVAPPGLNQAASMIVPDNITLIVSTLVSARIARWVYEWNVKIIQYRLF